MFGSALPGAPVRIYLTGGVCGESASGRLREEQFPSPQVRRLFVALVFERHRSLSSGQVAEILWPDRVPRAWESALKALVSKLRQVLKTALPELSALGPDLVCSRFGCYQLRLPRGAWIDVEAARQALDEAEGWMRAERPRDAWGPANVCLAITKRELLPGESGEWIEARRRELLALRLRALEGYVDVCLRFGQNTLAAQVAREAIDLEPFRESSFQRLMKAEAALGNRAEAVRAFHRCRDLLREELGVEPSPETQALFKKLLRETEDP